MAELPLLNELSFRRWMKREDGGQLVVFADASQEAYSAVAYLAQPQSTTLLYARGRVNSNAARTIPLLELLAAELGVIVGRDVARALGLPLSEVVFFGDSQPTLAWIKSPAREVSNHAARKLAQITEAVPPENWSYVPTDLNPADLISRGCNPARVERVGAVVEGAQISADGEGALEDGKAITANTFVRDLGREEPLPAPADGPSLRACSAAMRRNVDRAWGELKKALLPLRHPRHNQRREETEVKEGDVIVVLDVPNLPHCGFSLGRISKLYAGRDGVPRRADVVVRRKEYHRARSLAPLL